MVFSRILKLYSYISSRRTAKLQKQYDYEHLVPFLISGRGLSCDEKNAVAAKWGNIINVPVKWGFPYYQALKEIDTFNADYLPSAFYYPFIEGILNPSPWRSALSHKSMLHHVYNCGIAFPNTLICTYGGVYFNKDRRPVLRSEAASILRQSNVPLIFKPSIDTSQGKGVKLLSGADIDLLCNDIESGAVFSACGDFVLQELVSQSEDTAVFNPSSLNCFRVTTLSLDNQISICSIALKCGAPKAVVDNIGRGKRGVIVGVNRDGCVSDAGFFGNGELTLTHNGIAFRNKRIEHIGRVLDAAVTLHKYVPVCRLIGWDIALDEHNVPVLIEGNTVYPGISMEQMCSGPIFGDRTNEVIRYIREYQKIN